MPKSIFDRFKSGIFVASESFGMLVSHPVLLIYYLGLLLVYALIFILAYNIIGYHDACLQFSQEFRTPDNNLLAEIIPQTGGLVYLGFIFSIFLNIFLRTFVSVALVQHVHALLHGHKPWFKEVYRAAFVRRIQIFQWSLLVCGITLAVSAFSSAQMHSLFSIVIRSLSLLWLIVSFLVIPLMALTQKTLSAHLYRSITLLHRYLPEICGGLFWLGLLYVFTILSHEALAIIMPESIKEVCFQHNLAIFNTLFATVLLIFKTGIVHREITFK